MLNLVQLIGNLGREPEIRATQGGDKVATLSIATSERWKDKNTGEKREATEWHRVVVWGRLADVCEQYLNKGSKVYVQGKLKTRKWQDKSGTDRYTTEIVLSGFGSVLQMLDTRRSDSDQRHENTHESQTSYQPSGGDVEDSIPF